MKLKFWQNSRLPWTWSSPPPAHCHATVGGNLKEDWPRVYSKCCMWLDALIKRRKNYEHCPVSLFLSGHYDCHELRFSIICNVFKASCSQKLTSFCDINHSLSCVIFPHNCFVFFFFNININAMSLSNRLRKMGVGYIGGWVDILVGGYIGGWDPTGLLLPSCCCCCCCSCCSVYQSGKGDKKSVMPMLLSSKLRFLRCQQENHFRIECVELLEFLVMFKSIGN